MSKTESDRLKKDLCYMLGCASALIHELSKKVKMSQISPKMLVKMEWLNQNIEGVIYNRLPMTQMPEINNVEDD